MVGKNPLIPHKNPPNCFFSPSNIIISRWSPARQLDVRPQQFPAVGLADEPQLRTSRGPRRLRLDAGPAMQLEGAPREGDG